MPIRLYPDPSAAGRVGIPVDGELFETEDAERLIGQGIATRKRPKPDELYRVPPPDAEPPEETD